MTALRKLIVLAIVFISVPVAEGAEVRTIQLYHRDMVAKEGRKFHIPCDFMVDHPDTDHKIQLEWSVMRTGSDSFTPIIRLDDTNLLPVNHPNARASIDLKGVHNGHCSLVIDPIKPTDSGTYQIRIGVDYQETKDTTQKINIQVHGERDKHTRAIKEVPTDNNEDQPSDSQDVDQDTRRIAKIVQVLKNRGMILSFAIVGGLILLFLIVGCIAMFIGRRKYRKTMSKLSYSLMEQGRWPKNTPHQSIEEKGSPVTERHTKSELRGKPDVKIRIEDPTSSQSLKTEDRSPKPVIELRGKPDVKIRIEDPTSSQSLKTEDRSPKADTKPYFQKLMEEGPKEPAMHVAIDMEGPKAGTAEPSSPARKSKEKKRSSSEKSTTPKDTKEDDLYYYDFLGIRWGYNWGKYWIVYPRYWD